MSEEQAAAAAPKPASKKPMIVIGLVALVLGGGGGFAGATFLVGGSGEAAPEGEPPAEGEEAPAHGEEAPAEGHGEEAKAEGHGEAAEGEHGGGNAEVKTDPNGAAVIALGAPFTINLRGSGGGRVLRMDVQLEALGKDKEVITEKVPAIRDTILIATSDYSWSELEGTDGKTRLRDELLARVNGVTEPLAVQKIYFTQFVVQ